MFGIKQHLKLFVVGIILVLAIISAGYLWFSATQQPLTCTLNQTQGEALVIDQSLNNAVICTKLNNSVTLRLDLWDRVGGVWYLTNSSGLLVSDGIRNEPDQSMIGFGSIEWNVIPTSVGTQTLTAKCIQGEVGAGHEKLISSQNLTFVVT